MGGTGGRGCISTWVCIIFHNQNMHFYLILELRTYSTLKYCWLQVSIWADSVSAWADLLLDTKELSVLTYNCFNPDYFQF